MTLKYRDEDFHTVHAPRPGRGRWIPETSLFEAAWRALPGCVHGAQRCRLLGCPRVGPGRTGADAAASPPRASVAGRTSRGPGRGGASAKGAHAREPARGGAAPHPRERDGDRRETTGGTVRTGKAAGGGAGRPLPLGGCGVATSAAAPFFRPLAAHGALHLGLAALGPARRLAGGPALLGRDASWRARRFLAEARGGRPRAAWRRLPVAHRPPSWPGPPSCLRRSTPPSPRCWPAADTGRSRCRRCHPCCLRPSSSSKAHALTTTVAPPRARAPGVPLLGAAACVDARAAHVRCRVSAGRTHEGGLRTTRRAASAR